MAKEEKNQIGEKLHELERQVDLSLNEKKYEKIGVQGLNQRIIDLNTYVKDL
jgi:hypothetical protein